MDHGHILQVGVVSNCRSVAITITRTNLHPSWHPSNLSYIPDVVQLQCTNGNWRFVLVIPDTQEGAVRVQIPFVLVQLIPPRTFHPSVFLESAVESDVLVADSDSGLDDSPSLGCETGGKNSEVRNISGASYGKRVLRGVLVTEESVDLINLLNRLDNDPSLV
uniref:Uncharacterized protein n=1 Tax=Cacopsylla melanoneura TaxID=428564 RepID=A0A8D9DX77_9HEMI